MCVRERSASLSLTKLRRTRLLTQYELRCVEGEDGSKVHIITVGSASSDSSIRNRKNQLSDASGNGGVGFPLPSRVQAAENYREVFA